MSLTRNRPLLLVPATVLALVLLAGCASDDADTATSEATATATPAQEDGDAARPAGGGAGGGGTRGEIAAIDGTVMQVQGDDGQTAVSWSDTTTITQTVAGTLADVTAGVCVTAAAGATDETDDPDAATSVTSVAVSVPTDDGCSSGFGGAGAGREMPSGMPTDMPSGMPTDLPSGMPTGGGGAGGGFGARTSGLVTGVSGTTITLEVTGQDDAVTTTTIEVSDATTYTTTAAANSSAIVVGQCVTAQGESDDSGQVVSTSLALSAPGESGCSTGFGGARGRGDDA